MKALSVQFSEIDVIVDKKMRIIESGGVQIRDVTLRPIPGKPISRVPTLQKYQFIPYINNERVCITDLKSDSEVFDFKT